MVIISVEDYIKEADRQLKDKDFHAELNPTKHHEELINETIRALIMEKLIKEQIGKILLQNNPETPNLYFCSKVHKTNYSGRPIVSSITSHSSRISEFVDIHLEPIVNGIKLHIKDTTDFVNKFTIYQTTQFY